MDVTGTESVITAQVAGATLRRVHVVSGWLERDGIRLDANVSENVCYASGQSAKAIEKCTWAILVKQVQ